MQCVILAGGLGTRILPLSESVPKNLIDINGKPFAYYQLSWLAMHGITEVIYCVGHLGNQIKEYVKDGSQWNLSVKYVDEGSNLLGTGGALRLAFDQQLLEDKFAVIYGDSFLPINIKNIWQHFEWQSCAALMTIYKNNNALDKSNVLLRKDNTVLYNKHREDATYIDYGLSILYKFVIENIPANTKYDLSVLYNSLSLQNGIYGQEVFDRFYEIGSFKGIEDFKEWVKNSEAFYNT